MPHLPPRTDLTTHEVANQPPDPGDLDLWAGDSPLRDHAAAAGADGDGLARFGARIGTSQMRAAGRDANRHSPCS